VSTHTGHSAAFAAISRAVVRCVAGHGEIQVAYVFGSVARGRTRPDSDIDVAVLLRRRLPPSRALRYRLQLAGELGAALERDDVQVVILNEASPLLAHRVLSNGIVVYERSRPDRVRFQVETARRYEDLIPTLERYVARLKQDVRDGRLSG
jgi:predicted nucleotidyltransferase